MQDNNDPYDPDMTVEEALNKGLIAIIDSGRIGSTYYEPCLYDFDDTWACTRAKGHDGVHAHVMRWMLSKGGQRRAEEELAARNQEQAERLRKQINGVSASMGEIAQAASAAADGAMNEAQKKIMERYLHKQDSMTYQRRSQMYRDHNVGKVRGK